MRSSRVLFMLVLAILITSFLDAPVLRAESVMSNWATANNLKHDFLQDYNSSDCKNEIWSIDTDPGLIYTTPSQSGPQDRCVYRVGDLIYAKYSRTIGAYSPFFTEHGIAIAFGEASERGVLTPAYGFGDIVSISPSGDYIGIESSAVDSFMLRVKDYREKVEYNSDRKQYIFNKNDDAEILQYNGTPLSYSYYAMSANSRWLVFVNGNRLIRYDLNNNESVKIGEKLFTWPGAWPHPSVKLFISNDGHTVGFGGMQNRFWVLELSEQCTLKSDKQSYAEQLTVIDKVYSACPNRDLYGDVENFGTASSNGYLTFGPESISNDGTSIIYTDGKSYQKISYQPQPLVQYLALGDSFASGEGDMTYDGKNYQTGTDIDGSEMLGVPREKCHLSNRSHPILLGYGMSLKEGTDYHSVACSGAVKSDVLTTGQDGSSYLGQTAPKFGLEMGGEPRLSRVPDAKSLQDQALENFTPGRIRQIEFVKKVRPAVLTIMIGGNDISFGGAMAKCVVSANLTLKNETKCDLGEGQLKEDKAQEIYSQYKELKAFYETLKGASPATKVYVLGYPKFFDDKSSCGKELVLGRIRAESRQGINQLLDYMNATIKAASNDANVNYIDMSDSLLDSTLCGKGVAVNGLNSSIFSAVMSEYMKYKTEVADKNIERYGQIKGTTNNLNILYLNEYVKQRAGVKGENTLRSMFNPAILLDDLTVQLMHPNASGHQYMYEHLQRALGENLLFSDTCEGVISCPDGLQRGAPKAIDYVKSVEVDDTKVTKEVTEGITLEVNGHSASSVLRVGEDFEVKIENEVLPSLTGSAISEFRVELHSDPIDLGVMTPDSNGDYTLRAHLPANTPVGWHTLHLISKEAGEKINNIYRWIFVQGPMGDYDGDGIADGLDTCAFGTASGIDAGGNDIDDACEIDYVFNNGILKPLTQSSTQKNNIDTKPSKVLQGSKEQMSRLNYDFNNHYLNTSTRDSKGQPNSTPTSSRHAEANFAAPIIVGGILLTSITLVLWYLNRKGQK